MKRIKNLFFLLTIMLISFLTINNVKAAENYGLWVNGEEFTSVKTTINCGSGTATFNKSTNTLTLNNTTISKVYNKTLDTISLSSSIYYAGTSRLNINLVGVNQIYSNNSTDLYESISIRSGSIYISGSGSAYISAYNSGYNDIIQVGINSKGNIMIDGAKITINLRASSLYSEDLSIGLSSETGIIIMEGSQLDIGADVSLFSANDDSLKNILLYDGYLTSAARYDVFWGNLNLDNFSGKIMAGFSEDGTNANLYTNEEFLELTNKYYINYVKLGNFATYRINNTSKPSGLLYTPTEAFYQEPIKVVGGYNDNGNLSVYKLKTVQILDSDGYDITSEIGYNSSTREFKMPNYPITINADFTKDFKVKPTTFTAKLYGYNDIKLSWDSIGTEGYYIYYKKGTAKNYQYLGSTTNLTYKKANLSAGTKYTFKIIPYAKVNGRTIKSDSYKVTSIYTLKKMNKPTFVKGTNKAFKIKWKKVNGATKYQIARSLNKTKNYKTIKTVSNTYSSYVLKAIKNKTYYYKIRACNGNVCGPWSTAKAYTLK